MKVAIFGDIHANLEALNTVLNDAHDQQCDLFCCIGDIVGYNSNPSECMQIIKNMECPVVMGNHDLDCSNDSSLDDLNNLAKIALQWTRDALDNDEKEWLSQLKYSRPVRNFTIVHSSLDSPTSWTYIKNRFDAEASFNYQNTQVCFYGHTHVPSIFTKMQDEIDREKSLFVNLEVNKKYFVNVGSVGQPRDGDWRSSYCIYDIANKTLELKRLEYDIQRTQQKILKVGLPHMLAERLKYGK